MSQTQVVVHLGKAYFRPQGQIRIVQQMKLGTSVIGLPHFHGIFTGQSISEIILFIMFIQGDLQGLKVNFRVK